MSEHYDVTLAPLRSVFTAGLVGALLVVAPAGAAGAASPLGDEPSPPPDDAGSRSPDDEPVLQPADDSQVVILNAEDPVEQTDDTPGAAEPGGGSGDRSGALEPEGLGLVAAIGVGLLGLVSLVLAGISATRLRRMLHAWRSPASLRATGIAPGTDPPATSFSLMVAARRDEDAFGRTLERLAAFEHPSVEVLAVVGHDDLGAREVASAAAFRQPHRIRVVVDRRFRKSEPPSLNTGLAECRGDMIGVFQPGDEVRPGLLRHVEAALEATEADVVQTGVLLTDKEPSWFSVRRMLESYFWFRSRLHYYAQRRFTPLATTSLFVRADVLRRTGGWDEDSVAEGCELGVRLSVAGVPMAVTWDPGLATRAAVPQGIRALSHQQTRWIQGFLQVLRRGGWRQLPSRRQRLLAGTNLAMPFLEAIAGAAIPILAVLAVVADLPPPIVLAACLPLIPALMTVAVEMAGLGDLGRTSGVRIGARDWLRLVLGAIPYQLLVAASALRALVRELRRGRSRDTVPHATTGDAAGIDGSDRPQVVDLSTGRRGQLDQPVRRAGAVDR